MKYLLFIACTFGQFLNAQELIQINGFTQGTTFHIQYLDIKNRNFEHKMVKILTDFDNSVSTYNANSIISKVNRNEKNIKLDTYFTTCFTEAKHLFEITHGAFDPTVYPLVNAWGFGPEKKQAIEQTKLDSILTFVGFDKIRIDKGTVVKSDPRVQLDFNAFAQGYSVDVLADFLQKKGIKDFIIEIGGEVRAHGHDQDQFIWRVGIEQPIENKIQNNAHQVIIELDNKAVATSGNYRRFIEVNGKKIVHNLNPSTGLPTANNLLSASVFCSDALSADALATGFLVMGLEKTKIFLELNPEIGAYLIYSNDKGEFEVFMSPQLEHWIINKP